MSILLGTIDQANVARTRGVVGGATILGAFGTFWCFAALLNWAARPAGAIPIAVVIAVALLGTCGVRLLAASRVHSADNRAAAAAGKRSGMWFGIIFTIEVALIAVSSVLLANRGLSLWIPVAAALIIGIHFLPLARVFRVPAYYGTGVCCVLGTLACLPIHDMGLRLLAVGLVMAVVLWGTCLLLLWRTRNG